jgi:hypothetical protein
MLVWSPKKEKPVPGEMKSPHRYFRANEPRERVSSAALLDRALRQTMKETQSLTGRLMGDPPPGWSALDRRC